MPAVAKLIANDDKNPKITQSKQDKDSDIIHTDDYEVFEKIIDNNEYVKKCVSNKKKDTNSLSYLVSFDMSQSDAIKLGTGIEKILADYITSNKNMQNIKSANEKGVKEKDHLFKNDETMTIYYAEIKSNLYLDTEKCVSTSSKCSIIEKQLKEQYRDYDVKMFLVGTRYYTKDVMPAIITKKYLSIIDNVVGVNEYLKELGMTLQFTDEDAYKKIINYTVERMFYNQ